MAGNITVKANPALRDAGFNPRGLGKLYSHQPLRSADSLRSSADENRIQNTGCYDPQSRLEKRNGFSISRIVTITLLLLLIAIPAPSAKAAEVHPLGLFGNDEVLWVFQRRPDQAGALHLHFSFWLLRDIESGGYFRPHIQGLRGAIAKAALRGTALYATYRDGTHWRYNAQVFSRLPTAKPLRAAERNIPGNVVPLAIGSDHERSVIYAVVTARQALDILKVALEAKAIDEIEAIDYNFGEKNPREKTTSPPEITTDCAIIRYEDGQWYVDRNAPQDLSLGTIVSAIAGYGGAVHLVYEDPSAPNTFRHKESKKKSAAWSEPTTISFDAPLECAILSLAHTSPVVVASLEKNNAVDISIHRLQDGAWSLSKVLADSEGRVRHFARPVAVSFFASDIAVATQDAEHVVSVGRWSLDSGRPVGPMKTVQSLQSSRLTGPESRVRILIQYGILGGILTVVFLRRRESVTLVASIKKNQQLAPFSHRLAAFLIDMSILFPIWGTLMYQQLFAARAGRSVFERLATGESISPNELLFWLRAIIGAIFGLYCFIFESINAATPGKRIVGLSVVSDMGEPGSFLVILIRNLVRPIEFYFPPVALLVMVTPSRQRLGDLLARTVVVMPKDTAVEDDANQDPDNNGHEPHLDEKA